MDVRFNLEPPSPLLCVRTLWMVPKNNLRIDGINEEKGETWEMCETNIKSIFQDKLEVYEHIIIERAHRTKGKTTRNNAAGKKQPRTMVIKLANYKDKSMLLRNVHNLKGSDI